MEGDIWGHGQNNNNKTYKHLKNRKNFDQEKYETSGMFPKKMAVFHVRSCKTARDMI